MFKAKCGGYQTIRLLLLDILGTLYQRLQSKPGPQMQTQHTHSHVIVSSSLLMYKNTNINDIFLFLLITFVKCLVLTCILRAE